MSFFSRMTKSASAEKSSSANDNDPSVFTLPKLRALHKSLVENKNVNVTNLVIVRENLRHLAEMVVYGDSKSELLFDFFCEKNMLSLFLEIMRSAQGCPQLIYVQIFQTLSILCQCVKNDTSLYYLFSNNYINEMISFPFNFEEEELCENFVSFLKTIALRLNSQTIQFFFIEENSTFPLLTKAILFLQYRDPMVRTAAQTAILNIYRIDDAKAREYSLKEEIICLFVTEVTSLMEGIYTAIVTLCIEYATYALHPNTRGLIEGIAGERIEEKLKSLLCSMEDWLYYLQDIFGLNIHLLTSSLVEHLSTHYIYPVLLDPLLRISEWNKCVIYTLPTIITGGKDNSSSGATTGTSGNDEEEEGSNRKENGQDDDSKPMEFHDDTSVSLVVSLFLISQIFTLIKDKQIRRSLCVALFHPMSQKQRKFILAQKRKKVDIRIEDITISHVERSNDYDSDNDVVETTAVPVEGLSNGKDIGANELNSPQIPKLDSSVSNTGNNLSPNPYRIAFQQLLTCKIDRFALLATSVVMCCMERDNHVLNMCYDSNQHTAAISVDFATNTMHSLEGLFLWPLSDDISHTSWAVLHKSNANVPDSNRQEESVAVTTAEHENVNVHENVEKVVVQVQDVVVSTEGGADLEEDENANKEENPVSTAIQDDLALDQWLEMSTLCDENGLDSVLVRVMNEEFDEVAESNEGGKTISSISSKNNLARYSTSRKSVEDVDMMEVDGTATTSVLTLLKNGDALSLIDLHTLAQKSVNCNIFGITSNASMDTTESSVRVEGMSCTTVSVISNSVSSVINPTESMLYIYVNMLGNCCSHSLVVMQIVTITVYDMIRFSHMAHSQRGAGAPYPAPTGRSLRAIRESIRRIAQSLLTSLNGWLADTIISQFEEEIKRYSVGKTSWHQNLHKMALDKMLLFPLTSFLHQRIGMDHVIPISQVEVCRRELQSILMLRSLYKRISELFANPLAVTSSDDISKNIIDDYISNFGEFGVSAVRYIPGESMVMRGRVCHAACIINPNIDLAEFVNSGKIGILNAQGVYEENKNPAKALPHNSRRSSLAPSSSPATAATKAPPAKRSSIYTFSSSSSKEKEVVPPVQPVLEKARKIGEVFFVNDDNSILLSIPDKTKLDMGRVLLAIPILKSDITIDDQDDRNMKILLRSSEVIGAMDRISDGKTPENSWNNNIPSILPPRPVVQLYQITIGFENKKVCESIVKAIEVSRSRAKLARMEGFRTFLTKWSESNRDNPEL